MGAITLTTQPKGMAAERRSERRHAFLLDDDFPEETAGGQANLLWLCGEMERLGEDVIDREICRRLRMFAARIDFDLPDEIVMQLKTRRSFVNTDLIPEALLPFYRHYQFMLKRNRRKRMPVEAGPETD